MSRKTMLRTEIRWNILYPGENQTQIDFSGDENSYHYTPLTAF